MEQRCDATALILTNGLPIMDGRGDFITINQLMSLSLEFWIKLIFHRKTQTGFYFSYTLVIDSWGYSPKVNLPGKLPTDSGKTWVVGGEKPEWLMAGI